MRQRCSEKPNKSLDPFCYSGKIGEYGRVRAPIGASLSKCAPQTATVNTQQVLGRSVPHESQFIDLQSCSTITNGHPSRHCRIIGELQCADQAENTVRGLDYVNTNIMRIQDVYAEADQ